MDLWTVSSPVALPAQEHEVGIHVPPSLRPREDVVQLGGIQGQRAPAIPADASPLLEETESLLPPPLSLLETGEEATGALPGHMSGII